MVVEVVGASPMGQASGARGKSSFTSAALIRVESGIGADGDDGNAIALGIGDEIGQFRRLPAPGQQQQHILAGDGAHVAMAGFRGMDEIGRRAGGGQGGGGLARDMAGFAHAADDDASLGRQHQSDGVAEIPVQGVGQLGQAPRWRWSAPGARLPGRRWPRRPKEYAKGPWRSPSKPLIVRSIFNTQPNPAQITAALSEFRAKFRPKRA